jgi:hypothetical protein
MLLLLVLVLVLVLVCHDLLTAGVSSPCGGGVERAAELTER